MGQNERIVRVLKSANGDGLTALDLYRLAGTLAASSRMHEIRKDGHVIECSWDGSHWRYYYISGPDLPERDLQEAWR